MSDRELLELAAKAAGYKVRWHESSLYGPSMEIMEDDAGGPPWNPLTDDGDALRLAVKLKVHLEFAGHASREADRVQVSPRGNGHLAWVQMFDDNDFAATRQAIVRAVAEIGRNMP